MFISGRKNVVMKTKQIKLLQEVRELNLLPVRAAAPQPGGLYLMRLRARFGLPKPVRKPTTISITFRELDQFHAQPVKITHL